LAESTTRVQLHDQSVAHVHRILAAQGFSVQPGGRRAGARTAANRFDLIADNLTVAVRAAKRSSFSWRVAVHGRRYAYRYRGHRWNLHSRGNTRLNPDIWILVAAGERERVFVVPGQRVRGFYTLTLREPSRTWLLIYENRWDTIRELTRQPTAA
jgi:hypothetical protein